MKSDISGCEDYYNPAAKKKKEELASSLGADLKSDEFSMFIKLLKNSGVLKGNLLIPEKSASAGLGGKLGGRQGGGRAGRPGPGRPGPGRPGLGRPRGLHGGRPRKGGRLRGPGGRRQRPLRPRIPSFDYYDYEFDYDDYQEAQPGSPETPAESRSFAQSPVGRRPRPPSPPQVIIATNRPLTLFHQELFFSPNVFPNVLVAGKRASKFSPCDPNQERGGRRGDKKRRRRFCGRHKPTVR